MGPMAKGHDVTYYKTWYRSSRGEVQVCSERRPIRNLTFQDLHLHHSGHQANTSQDLAQRYGLESVSDHHGNFSITMRNLTPMDSGLYCCLVVEIRHHRSEQRVHGAMELQVQTTKQRQPGASRTHLHPGRVKASQRLLWLQAPASLASSAFPSSCSWSTSKGRWPPTAVPRSWCGWTATTHKELKTPALRSPCPPKACRRPNRGLRCPTWLSGSLQSPGGTCFLSPALLCLHQALAMSSSQPSTPCLTLQTLRPSRPAGASGQLWRGLGQVLWRQSWPSEWPLSRGPGPGFLPPALSPDSLRYLWWPDPQLLWVLHGRREKGLDCPAPVSRMVGCWDPAPET
ncbi:V-type immunoglobulin domain-containing suppressor of T-cell activation isoform X1 [Mirounga angustirostris]|uniref:V-type immunoglobulin domain-containing suppressor of T-cell activation isoform X1 n=1 Tax=Mirounga angustirostris TaxID=9716 RepID=UPI00313D7838